VNRCTRCCIPDYRPDTAFVDGVCSACLSYAKRPTIDWAAREKDLLALLDRHNGRCIVPSSGGKDSTYQAITLLELGADVTVVTARTCHLTDMGRKNIDNLAKHARTIEVTPNMTTRAKLNRIGLEMVGDISWPEHVSIFTTPFRVAMDLGIPLIFYGENPQSQYGGPLGSEEAKQMTRRWTQEFGGFLGLRPSDLIGVEGLTARDMQDYELPSPLAMDTTGLKINKGGGIEAHFLGQYIPWDSHRNVAVAEAHGFQYERPTLANFWAFENQDNAQTGAHDFLMFLKYGYGRGCAQISVDVRDGLISRDTALRWVEKHDGIFPSVYMGVLIDEVLDRIGMTARQFHDTCARFTHPELMDGHA
jgi:N-acetyl sugar amidotransferase